MCRIRFYAIHLKMLLLSRKVSGSEQNYVRNVEFSLSRLFEFELYKMIIDDLKC